MGIVGLFGLGEEATDGARGKSEEGEGEGLFEGGVAYEGAGARGPDVDAFEGETDRERWAEISTSLAGFGLAQLDIAAASARVAYSLDRTCLYWVEVYPLEAILAHTEGLGPCLFSLISARGPTELGSAENLNFPRSM